MNYNYSVADAVRRNAVLFPKEERFIYADLNRRFTWPQFHERSSRAANVLLGMGLKKDEKIGVLSENSNEYLEIFYGCAKTGIVFVTMNPRLSEDELIHILNNCDVKVLAISETYWGQYENLLKNSPKIEKTISISNSGKSLNGTLAYNTLLDDASSVDPEVEIDIDDVMVIVNTSGTTGLPKAGLVTHMNFYIQGLEFNAEFGLKPDDVFLMPWPLSHISLMVFHAYSMRGMKSLFINFEPKLCAKVFDEEKVTVTWLVPTMLSMLLDLEGVDKFDFSNLRHITWSGSPMPPSLAKKCVEKWGNIFSTMLGSTENAALAIFLRSEELAKDNKLLASVGRPAIAKNVRVVKEDGNEVIPGSDEIGEMIVSGSFFKGYLNDPEKTEETIKGKWLYTGDMMRIDENGFYYLVDRKSFLIKTGALKVYPLEVENVIVEIPEVADVGVIGLDDEKWGEAVTAVVAVKPDQKISSDQIIDYCKSHMASFKVPKKVIFLDELPRDGAGKLSKRILKGMVEG